MANPAQFAQQQQQMNMRQDRFDAQTTMDRPRDDGGIYNGASGGPGRAGQILDQWGTTNNPVGPDYSRPGWYKNGDNREAMESYSRDYAVPYFNAALAKQTQDYNQSSDTRNFGETQRVNTHGMGLADRGSAREDLALSYGQKNNVRDFGEAQRQYNQGFGLEQELGRGTLAATNYANQTNRNQVNNQNLIQQEQNRIAQYEAQTGRQDVEGRQRLDQFSNDTARMGVNNQLRLGEGQLKNDSYNNETTRLGVNNQMTLGQGQLGFQNRQLDTDEAYRRTALTQEGAIARERMATDSMNQRYATFGRASAPNTRAMRSWN
jgi:hypothetical protein